MNQKAANNPLSPQSAGHRARKRFGQNFLQDQSVIDRIVQHVAPQADQNILEIGPGLGALTQSLLSYNPSLTVIELDRDLAQALPRRLQFPKQLNVIEADALAFDYSTLKQYNPHQQANPQYRVVGNLPYNISTPLLFHLLQFQPHIADMYFMLQKEVVERITAQPNTKDYGRLSVMLQYACEAHMLFEVPPEAFNPAPKVTSAVFKLIPYANKPLVADNEKHLGQIVTHLFTQRRKSLRGILKGKMSEEELKTLNIDPMARPENLTIENFITISNYLNKLNKA